MPAPRLCPHCGTANDPAATFCGACAAQLLSTSRALVRAEPRSALPVLTRRDQATLGGVALGVAALAVRIGSALLREAARSRPASPALPESAPLPANRIRVRRRWVVGDRDGPQRWGEEELELERPTDDNSAFRITFK